MKPECTPENAPRLLDWIATRGGVAVWASVDLRDPAGYCLTPAKTTTGEPITRPGWQWANEPTVITDPAEINVYEETLFKAIPVALRRSSNGLSLKVTDASQRKVDKLVAQCERKHGSAHTRKGILLDAPASIGVFYTSNLIPLSEFKP